MTVSIITVVYNRKDSIARTIESVLEQSYKNIEIIIIDGGSKDGTVDIINGYKHTGMKFISEPDKGIYDALNKGIILATGEVVGILHADDVFSSSGVLEIIAKTFSDNALLDAVYGDVQYEGSATRGRIVRYYSSERFHIEKFKYGYMPAHPSFFCKRSLFFKYGFYRTDMKIGADFELLLRFLGVNRVNALYSKICTTTMTTGGISTSGVKSVIQINKDFLKALKINHIKSSYLHLYSRYFIKWKEFF